MYMLIGLLAYHPYPPHSIDLLYMDMDTLLFVFGGGSNLLFANDSVSISVLHRVPYLSPGGGLAFLDLWGAVNLLLFVNITA